MSVAGYFLSVLFCLLSMLISDPRFDLVWFRLSCDHGWIRSGSVNVRKQQQQQHTDGVHRAESTDTGPAVVKVARETVAAYSGNPVYQLTCAPIFITLSTGTVQWISVISSARR